MKPIFVLVISLIAISATRPARAEGDPKADKIALCEELAGKRTGDSRKQYISKCKASVLDDERIAIERKCNADAGKRTGKALDDFLSECRRKAFEAARKKKQDEREKSRE